MSQLPDELKEEIEQAKKMPINALRRKVASLGEKGNGKKHELLTRYEEALVKNYGSRKRKAELDAEGEPPSKVAKISAVEKIQVSVDSNALSEAIVLSKYTAETGEFIKHVDRLRRLHRISTSLESQQQVWGTCLKKPFPLTDDGAYKVYLLFLEDITRTALYKNFSTTFVPILQDLTSDYQKAALGVVLQVSGYGKTHIAKVYSRYNNAIVLNFSRAFTGSEHLHDALLNILTKIKADMGVNEKDPESYDKFSRYSLRAINILLYAAVEHYGLFYMLLANNNNEDLQHADIQYMCARIFDNGCLANFSKRVKRYWADHLYEDQWFDQFVDYVQTIQRAVKVSAIFCDEVHGLKKQRVGEFLHTHPPSEGSEGDLAKMVKRALFEVSSFHSPEKSGGAEWDDVRDAYKRPTSVSYQIVAALEQVSRKLQVAAIMLTTDYSGMDFTAENNEASRNRMPLKEFEFNRDPEEENKRYLHLITEHYGFDLLAYLKKKVVNYKELMATWSRRPLYFSFIFHAIMLFAQNSKPDVLTEKDFDQIWPTFMSLCRDQGKYFVNGLMSKNKQMFYLISYSALFHNGNHIVNFQQYYKTVDIGYIPIIQNIAAQANRMADVFMLGQFQKEATADDYMQSLLEQHKNATDSGNLGEDLLTYLLLTNKGQFISTLAVPGSQFHSNSLAGKFCVSVVRAATMDDFNYEAMQVLTKPSLYLKDQYVKMPDTVKPDGLTLLVNGHDNNDHLIGAFQAKYWTKLLDFNDIKEALQSINPSVFFQDGTKVRTAWLKAKNDQLWKERYIRVICAPGFSATAVSIINEYNMKAEHANQPIVLVGYDKLPTKLKPAVHYPVPVQQAREDAVAAAEHLIDALYLK